MAGYNLKEGKYEERHVSDDELWSALSVVFTSKSVNDTSYKYGFLKAIIDNLYNVDQDLRLTFDQLFGKFGEIYWNLVLKYGLKQKKSTKDNRASAIERVLHYAAEKYQIREPIPYENLSPAAMLDISNMIKQKCKENVVGALFEDTRRLFYSFSKKGEWIQINPEMYTFICKHKLLVEKLNYYEWAKFLEKVNEEPMLTRLLNKIDESSKRTSLEKYRNILYQEFESRNCFYCGKPLNIDKTHVDHFIPWSFIKDDNLWNLVLACPDCNLKKKDKLPDIKFLTRIENRNKILLIENYKDEMRNYRPEKLIRIYDWAQKNGYDESWYPKTIAR